MQIPIQGPVGPGYRPGIWLLAAVLALLPLTAGAAGAADRVPPKGRVSRAQFTTAIRDREPVDDLVVLEAPEDHIYYFSELRGLKGHHVVHRWIHDGRVLAEVGFDVKGDRWRVFSRKTLLPDQTGRWTVEVVDQSGWPLRASQFEYRRAPAASSQ